jgi:hypothetical protein
MSEEQLPQEYFSLKAIIFKTNGGITSQNAHYGLNYTKPARLINKTLFQPRAKGEKL